MTLLRQVGILLVGLVLAGVMVVLGVWQLDVYHSQGRAEAERRATSPAVALPTVAQAGAAIGDGYGRPVQATGRYLPGVQVLVPLTAPATGYRVVSALRLADGDVVPVVRGVVPTAELPPPPTGEQDETGVLLPSEEAQSGALPPGQLSSVRLTTLAQSWPGPLLGGFITLTAADAAEQGLAPAPVELPEGTGRLRNGAYALQWWVFAAFALGMAIKMARDQVLNEDGDGLEGPSTEPGPSIEVREVTAEEKAPAT